MRKSILITTVSVFTFLFLALPMVVIIITAFGEAPIIQFPIRGFTFHWFSRVFASRSFMAGLRTSTEVALIASVLGVIVALPTSYALSKSNTRLSKALLSFFLSPNLIPGLVFSYALFQTMIIMFQIDVAIALILGHLLIVLPFSIRVLGAAFNNFDESIEEAAYTLGCSPLLAFFKVILPNLFSPLLVSFLMSFINSFNNLPVSMYLMGPGTTTLPIVLMNHVEHSFDPSVSAISVLLMIMTFGLMFVVDKAVGVGSLSS